MFNCMGRYGDLNYARLTKTGFLLGITLFIVGAGGELILHTLLSDVPAWEATLLFDLEAIGIVIAFFSPFIFGIFLPLTE